MNSKMKILGEVLSDPVFRCPAWILAMKLPPPDPLVLADLMACIQESVDETDRQLERARVGQLERALLGQLERARLRRVAQ